MELSDVKQLGIVKKVMAFLKLDEAGKIGNFFEKQIKIAEKAIRDLKRNKVTLENMHKDLIEDFDGRIEDAKINLQEAYRNVTLEDVANNAAIADFQDTYWGRISAAKEVIEDLESDLEAATERYEMNIEEIDEEIELYEERISALIAE